MDSTISNSVSQSSKVARSKISESRTIGIVFEQNSFLAAKKVKHKTDKTLLESMGREEKRGFDLSAKYLGLERGEKGSSTEERVRG